MKECVKCNKTWSSKEYHCRTCCTIFVNKEKSFLCFSSTNYNIDHCCKCKCAYDIEKQSHCDRCCVIHDKEDNHCCKCKQSYNSNEIHCCECKQSYNKNTNHCCNCKYIYIAKMNYIAVIATKSIISI